MKLSNQTWACIGLVSIISALALAGVPAHEKVVTEELTVKQHLTALRLSAEKHDVQFIGIPDVFEGRAPAGKGMSSKYRFWTHVKTADWTVLNRWSLGGECHRLFEQMGEYNKFAYVGPDEIVKLAQSHQAKPLAVWAYTPKFTQKPGVMASCAEQGLGFDEARGMLTFHGKPIALLADPYLRPTTAN